jgi:sigma-B regulation protein RsbU (phosphoserine phosphatase)
MAADPEHELRVAAAIQQSLLPPPHYVGPFFTTAGTSLPCRAIGGDFYDYVELAGDRFGFMLGDVSGKGPAAALVAAAALGMFSAEVTYHPSAAAVIKRLNDGLLARAIGARYVTGFYAVLARDGSFTYTNGGHHPPVLLSTDAVRRLDMGGVALGLFADAEFVEESLTLDRGDRIVVFSDGVTEAMNGDGDDFGEPRLLDCLVAHRADEPSVMVQAVIDAVLAFCGDVTPFDDMAILVTRYDG